MIVLNDSQLSAITRTATKLGITDPEWLIDLIDFETGGTFSPSVKNPLSSARGLIQFLDSTAIALGFESASELVRKNPTFEKQLEGPVYAYLRTWAPYTTQYDLFMAVFFPVARKYQGDTTFAEIFKDHYGKSWESKYTAFAKANPSIKTPNDYLRWVKKKVGEGWYLAYNTLGKLEIKRRSAVPGQPGSPGTLPRLSLVGLTGLAVLAWYFWKRKRSSKARTSYSKK